MEEISIFSWTFGIFYGQLVYFKANWYILWTFDIFCGNLVYFYPFWYVVQRKSGNPAPWNQITESFVLWVWQAWQDLAEAFFVFYPLFFPY
jgi:hypothetical protein